MMNFNKIAKKVLIYERERLAKEEKIDIDNSMKKALKKWKAMKIKKIKNGYEFYTKLDSRDLDFDGTYPKRRLVLEKDKVKSYAKNKSGKYELRNQWSVDRFLEIF